MHALHTKSVRVTHKALMVIQLFKLVFALLYVKCTYAHTYVRECKCKLL